MPRPELPLPRTYKSTLETPILSTALTNTATILETGELGAGEVIERVGGVRYVGVQEEIKAKSSNSSARPLMNILF